MHRMKTVLCTILLWGASAVAKPLTYHQLALKDLDQMAALVKGKIKDAHKNGESVDSAPLKEALRDVYSRPDESDNMIEKVVGPLRSEIDEADGWDSVLKELVEESVSVLQAPQGVKADEQVTHVIFLQNVIGTLKPKAKNGGVARELLEKIRDAKLEMTKAIRDERKLRLMKETASPSDVAAQILKATAPADEKK